jgi:uncharacterized protein (DUF58 family)
MSKFMLKNNFGLTMVSAVLFTLILAACSAQEVEVTRVVEEVVEQEVEVTRIVEQEVEVEVPVEVEVEVTRMQHQNLRKPPQKRKKPQKVHRPLTHRRR